MTRTKYFDLTATNVAREMYRPAGDPLADPTFRRHVAEITTAEQRRDQTDRLRKARKAA